MTAIAWAIVFVSVLYYDDSELNDKAKRFLGGIGTWSLVATIICTFFELHR